ncbi:MAG TPA: 4Fe-4S binding protein [Nitrososphaerales archaeon]
MQKKGWRDLPKGGLILSAGNAIEYKTGNWRKEIPVIDLQKCNNCMICWIYCPEGTISVIDGKVTGVIMSHCKGCGICAAECPTKVIEMKMETSE